jgi:hypothetical protein
VRARDAAVACLLLAAPVAAEEQVSLELLEFLGSFETAAGKWIDPTQLQTPLPEAPTVPQAPADAKEQSDE